MNYLISKFDAMIGLGELKHIKKGIAYNLISSSPFCVYGKGQIPFLFDPLRLEDNILKVNFNSDCCYVLYPGVNQNCSTFKIRYLNKDVVVNVSGELTVSYGETIFKTKLEKRVCYSHYDIEQDLCLIYFEGERNFIVVIKSDEIKSSYYDEYNEVGKEKFFMCKMFDCLNHGKVLHINSGKVEEYLVYLDEEDLCLKDEFIPCAFLDCIKCGNLKYANELLCEENKQRDEKTLQNFFEDFDDYEVIENNYILTKKNTLAGIYKFEIFNHKIENIINLTL